MQDVKETLESHMATFASDAETGQFTELAKRWASHSLETYSSVLLQKALALSQSLAEFDAELLQKDKSANA